MKLSVNKSKLYFQIFILNINLIQNVINLITFYTLINQFLKCLAIPAKFGEKHIKMFKKNFTFL